jgi:hypothetical protein
LLAFILLLLFYCSIPSHLAAAITSYHQREYTPSFDQRKLWNQEMLSGKKAFKTKIRDVIDALFHSAQYAKEHIRSRLLIIEDFYAINKFAKASALPTMQKHIPNIDWPQLSTFARYRESLRANSHFLISTQESKVLTSTPCPIKPQQTYYISTLP